MQEETYKRLLAPELGPCACSQVRRFARKLSSRTIDANNRSGRSYHLRREQRNVTGSASDVQNPHSLLNCRLSEETLRNRANNLRLSYQALQFRRCAAEYISHVQIPCSFLENVFVSVRCSMSGNAPRLHVLVRSY
jgi:hypothetical protein